MGLGRLPIAPKYSPKVPQHFPHQGKAFPDFLKNQYFCPPKVIFLSPITSMLSPQSPACSLPHHQHALSLITSMLSPPSPAGIFSAGAGQLDPAPVRKFLGNSSTGVQQKSKPATTTRPKPGFPV